MGKGLSIDSISISGHATKAPSWFFQKRYLLIGHRITNLCFTGTLTERQVSKRPVSSRPKRQVYKTSGLQNFRFTKRQGLRNDRFTERQVFKTSGFVLHPWLRIEDRGKVMTEFSQIFTHSHFRGFFPILANIVFLSLVISNIGTLFFLIGLQTWQFLYFLFNKYIKFENQTF
jgi:hypothetical protein